MDRQVQGGMSRIAALGECMLEISNPLGAPLSRDMSCRFSYGGDTLNTAVYLARLGVDTAYVTALGQDSYSDWLLAEWQAEGLAVELVDRSRDLLPGLYMIQTDSLGERSFQYWRGQSAARAFFADASQVAELATPLAKRDWLYFSGISLSLFSDNAFDVFLEVLAELQQGGVKIAFDGNYRPKNWPAASQAKARYTHILPYCALLLPSLDDEKLLFDDPSAEHCAARYRDLGVAEIVIKAGARGAYVVSAGVAAWVPALGVAGVVDSTGAGDAFNAAYLTTRLAGASALDSVACGHQLAAKVIQYPGAIIPAAAMPELLVQP
jgi:2-dehydro-3-deoxygluconokinase